jgi:hypothetical protein
MILSNITLGLLEDTGWYLPDYSAAEVLWWGWGQGCNFLNTKCPTDSGEFCGHLYSKGCDQYGDDKTICSNADTFSEGCNQ